MTFVLGGAQTDFARNLGREGFGLAEALREALQGALADARVDAKDVGAIHVGNFVGEILGRQGNLGGLAVEADPAFDGVATARHEGACASGSLAALAASADIEAGRSDVALVVGVEVLRGVSGLDAAQALGVAAWHPVETEGRRYPWPELFDLIAAEYAERHGLDRRHTVELAKNAFANAKKNPLAQTRGWAFDDASFAEDDAKNPAYAPRVRRQDCSQITDGAACVVLASPRYAARWAERHGETLAAASRLEGYGHRTTRMALADKLAASRGGPYVFPHVRGVVEDAYRRAGIAGSEAVDAFEVHDCFTITGYMAIDHLGLAPPGQPWRVIEDGTVALGGKKPVNPGGGLVGIGHPVGATGVRMLLDAHRQVTGRAGDVQVEGARRVATLNLGGSTTTTVSFVVGRGETRA